MYDLGILYADSVNRNRNWFHVGNEFPHKRVGLRISRANVLLSYWYTLPIKNKNKTVHFDWKKRIKCKCL